MRLENEKPHNYDIFIKKILHGFNCRLLIIVVAGLLLNAASCASPSRFGIAFISDRDGNDEIYRMTSDGQNVERLTYTIDRAVQVPRVSRDGRYVVFDYGGVRLERNLYLLNVESGEVVQLTASGGYDVAGNWDPDGSRFAFTTDRDNGYNHLYLMNPDGTNQRHVPLSTDSERGVFNVAWAPDGHALVYGTQEHIRARVSLTPTLHIVNLETLEVQPLTDANRHGACMSPDWSWDGEWIAMVCTHGMVAGDYGEIYLIRPDGTDFRPLTQRPADYRPNLPHNSRLTWVSDPRWAPDSKQIVYVAAVNGPWNIYVIGSDGTNNRRLTNHDAADWQLSVYELP